MKDDVLAILKEIWPDYLIKPIIGNGSSSEVYAAIRREGTKSERYAIKAVRFPANRERREDEDPEAESAAEEMTKEALKAAVDAYEEKIRRINQFSIRPAIWLDLTK